MLESLLFLHLFCVTLNYFKKFSKIKNYFKINITVFVRPPTYVEGTDL